VSSKDLFFNLSDFSAGLARNLAPGIDTRIFAGEQAMPTVVSFDPSSVGSVHSHAEEQWGAARRNDLSTSQAQPFA
jgi:hypothetical protein